MIVNYIKIENYRNFDNLEVELSKLSILIGENDSGKSNFLRALKLPFSSNELEFRTKSLIASDFNSNSINIFYKSLIDNEDDSILISKIPKIKITIRFDEINKNDYAKAIVANWINDADGRQVYEIQYIYKPKNENDFLEYAKEQIIEYSKENKNLSSLIIPTEFYDYSIISTNNGKQIAYNELRHITINTINAERDDFSESNSMKSNSILTKLLETKLNDKEKVDIYNAYKNFFEDIKQQENFKKIFTKDPDFSNIDYYIDVIDCIPNLANLKNILSNITLGYGNEFLFQKGLGQRNLIFILLFFQHYKNNESCFNLSCIEEPESHLSTNNLNLIIDYIKKSVYKSKDLFQTIVTSHKAEVINKLNFNNVIVLSANKAISLKNIDNKLVDYLAKRPNFDIFKLLFSNRIILVEGTTEEMFINTILSKNNNLLFNIDVLSIGQKGFKTFLDIWNKLNAENEFKKIGIIRDFDNQNNAKQEHNNYDNNKTIFVRTTTGYTLEDDLVSTENNCQKISTKFSLENNIATVANFLKDSKASNMLEMCYAIQNEDLEIAIPQHIKEIIDNLIL